MRFSRVYDFQRALCENSETIGAWFRLVENMRGKYGIQNCDFYNFDETGFMMGMIQATMVVTAPKEEAGPNPSSLEIENGPQRFVASMAKAGACHLIYWSKVPTILQTGIQRPICHAIGPLEPRPMDGQIMRSL